MSAPSPFSKAAASTGDSLRPEQDSYSPGCSPTPLAANLILRTTMEWDLNSLIFPSAVPKESFPSVPQGPGMHMPSPQGCTQTLQVTWSPFSRRGLAGWSLAPLDWVGAGTPQGQQKQELTASFPQSSGWALGPGHVQEHTLSRLAIGVRSAFRVDHKL